MQTPPLCWYVATTHPTSIRVWAWTAIKHDKDQSIYLKVCVVSMDGRSTYVPQHSGQIRCATIRPPSFRFFIAKTAIPLCRTKAFQGSVAPIHRRHCPYRTMRLIRAKSLPCERPSLVFRCRHRPSMYWVPPTTDSSSPLGSCTDWRQVYLGFTHLPPTFFF